MSTTYTMDVTYANFALLSLPYKSGADLRFYIYGWNTFVYCVFWDQMLMPYIRFSAVYVVFPDLKRPFSNFVSN